ncbi:hypothetical protein F7725_015164 [Dissostichus mawsoni]|uniref:Uncharacterized protein n=1 Tax=Dissostichus mawsoni TaxID=36200 RepID=A0A7J5YJK4_DISMA|nr:hypothetical protein F7725_015164 [Dissostichus mawsoni]
MDAPSKKSDQKKSTLNECCATAGLFTSSMTGEERGEAAMAPCGHETVLRLRRRRGGGGGGAHRAGGPHVHLFGDLQHEDDVRPLVWLRVMVRREGGVITLLDLLAEGEQVHLVPIKRTLQRCHLQKQVEDKLDERLKTNTMKKR